jgi:uncharacterized protein (DUF1810 family)
VTPDAADPYRLERFVKAQNRVYPQVREELRKGQKRSHWMWFIFPQIRGLGASPTAVDYAISSRDEAVRYLEHPVLGPRLEECTRLVTQVEGKSIGQIFPYPDGLKFRSCMTLFAHATANNQVFLQALQKYFGGEFDPLTLARL